MRCRPESVLGEVGELDDAGKDGRGDGASSDGCDGAEARGDRLRDRVDEGEELIKSMEARVTELERELRDGVRRALADATRRARPSQSGSGGAAPPLTGGVAARPLWRRALCAVPLPLQVAVLRCAAALAAPSATAR